MSYSLDTDDNIILVFDRKSYMLPIDHIKISGLIDGWYNTGSKMSTDGSLNISECIPPDTLNKDSFNDIIEYMMLCKGEDISLQDVRDHNLDKKMREYIKNVSSLTDIVLGADALCIDGLMYLAIKMISIYGSKDDKKLIQSIGLHDILESYSTPLVCSANFHTVIVLHGDVYTFGKSHYGQLGRTDDFDIPKK